MLVLTGARLEHPSIAGRLVAEIEEAVGHGRFALLLLGQGAFDVWGPDADLRAKLLELLPAVEPRQPAPVQSPDELVPGPVTTSRAELRERASRGQWADDYERGRQ